MGPMGLIRPIGLIRPRSGGGAREFEGKSTMNLFQQTRRAFLGRAATGLGSVALASLLNPRLPADEAKADAGRYQGVVNPLHFPPKAKRVI